MKLQEGREQLILFVDRKVTGRGKFRRTHRVVVIARGLYGIKKRAPLRNSRGARIQSIDDAVDYSF